jgi:hypothetical protein
MDNKRARRSVRAFAACVGVFATAVFAPAALAVPTLTGEALQGNGLPCDAGGVTTGTATGPYPGTFTAKGTTSGALGDPALRKASSSFTIRSGATTITGSASGQAQYLCTVFSGSVQHTFAPAAAYQARWTVTKSSALPGVLATRATYTDHGLSSFSWTVNAFFADYTSAQAQATLARCELVLLNLISLQLPASNCA